MAHELTKMEDGTWSMARAADSYASWHGLENVIPADAPFEEWLTRSGLNFTIDRSEVFYSVDGESAIEMPNRHVLYRKDTNAPLSIVSAGYNIVQPKQAWEFFRELCEQNKLKMETAGSIRGGLKFWAMASTGHQKSVSMTDILKQYVLFASSADSSMATVVKHTNFRVECSNTFHASINMDEAAIRVRHSTQFDETQVKLDLGLMAEEFDAQVELAQALHGRGVTATEAQRWFAELLSEQEDMTDQQVADYTMTSRLFPQFWDGYVNGRGAEEGTAWGLFNGVTYTVDHVRGRSNDTRLDSAWFGHGASLKTTAWEKAVALL